KKYYEEINQSEFEYDPYSTVHRKRKWWQKKTKYRNDRLKKYKFYGRVTGGFSA
ncbi:hypothetical protein DPMN_150414, partial [Dreissena polymorpha]